MTGSSSVAGVVVDGIGEILECRQAFIGVELARTAQAAAATAVSCASTTNRDSKFFDVPEIMSDSLARVIAT
jgi:hypothetical protein